MLPKGYPQLGVSVRVSAFARRGEVLARGCRDGRERRIRGRPLCLPWRNYSDNDSRD